MTKHERELLEHAKTTKENWPARNFYSWLRGFRMVNHDSESDEFAAEMDKLMEDAKKNAEFRE